MKVVKLYRPALCPGGCGKTFAVNNDRRVRAHWVGYTQCVRDQDRVVAEPELIGALW